MKCICLTTLTAARFLHLCACLTCSSVHVSTLHPMLAHHHLCYVDIHCLFLLYFSSLFFYCIFCLLFVYCCNLCCSIEISWVISLDNTKRKAGRAGGPPCCQTKNMNIPGTGELHRRAGRQAVLQDGPVGCTLRRADRMHIKLGCNKRAGRRAALFFRPACPFPQPATPPFCATCQLALLSSVQPAKNSFFHLETRPSWSSN